MTVTILLNGAREYFTKTYHDRSENRGPRHRVCFCWNHLCSGCYDSRRENTNRRQYVYVSRSLHAGTADSICIFKIFTLERSAILQCFWGQFSFWGRLANFKHWSHKWETYACCFTNGKNARNIQCRLQRIFTDLQATCILFLQETNLDGCKPFSNNISKSLFSNTRWLIDLLNLLLSTIPIADAQGFVMLVVRGGCFFADKLTFAQVTAHSKSEVI